MGYETAKKAGLQISIYMGITMSFFLSLFENILSGHFTLILFLVTFGASTALSFVIGYFVPMGPITSAATRKLKSGGLSARIVSSLISDIIFTPVLTIAMVTLVRLMLPAPSASQLPPYHVMVLGSLIPGMILGFILALIFMPVYQKMVFTKLGLSYPPEQQAPGE